MLDHYKAKPVSRYLKVMGVMDFKTANKPLARPVLDQIARARDFRAGLRFG